MRLSAEMVSEFDEVSEPKIIEKLKKTPFLASKY